MWVLWVGGGGAPVGGGGGGAVYGISGPVIKVVQRSREGVSRE
jgi:hypothetical protein